MSNLGPRNRQLGARSAPALAEGGAAKGDETGYAALQHAIAYEIHPLVLAPNRDRRGVLHSYVVFDGHKRTQSLCSLAERSR